MWSVCHIWSSEHRRTVLCCSCLRNDGYLLPSWCTRYSAFLWSFSWCLHAERPRCSMEAEYSTYLTAHQFALMSLESKLRYYSLSFMFFTKICLVGSYWRVSTLTLLVSSLEDVIWVEYVWWIWISAACALSNSLRHTLSWSPLHLVYPSFGWWQSLSGAFVPIQSVLFRWGRWNTVVVVGNSCS